MTFMKIRTAKVKHAINVMEAFAGEGMAVQLYKDPQTALNETITMLKYELKRHERKKK
jgi:hypothetical protein